jgi:ribosomal protein S18 acetylase RimI-like enzyme
MKRERGRAGATDSVIVRPYTPDDLEFVRRVFAEYTTDEKRRLMELGFVYSWSSDNRYVRSLPKQTRKGGVFLVATSGGKRAGCVAAIRRPRRQNWSWDATRRPSGLIMELHVARQFRGRGIGGRLLRAVEQHFRSKGSDWLSLGVFPTNETARAIYRKMGYRDVYVFMGKQLGATQTCPGDLCVGSAPPMTGTAHARAIAAK